MYNDDTALFGVIGGLGIFFLNYKYENHRKTLSAKLVFYQNIAFFMDSFANFILPAHVDVTCILQGLFSVYGIQASTLWLTTITTILALMAKQSGKPGGSKSNIEENLIYYHCICWYV
jgi:hypothetical protein